ncbi:hypothetical protein STCU_10273 [Strigomonas culicis]|uniref:Uncharacterized protein n=1 Tax=Strigomonas culicis TaxID=28005 RepID=S9TNP6_9TRYP|nr:hypothetical protein STCU_10273 [Strigomonas culicis]|eukprot:EPY18008.1 hypothetical protein STCU_10273 [Strigomonas culicis]
MPPSGGYAGGPVVAPAPEPPCGGPTWQAVSAGAPPSSGSNSTGDIINRPLAAPSAKRMAAVGDGGRESRGPEDARYAICPSNLFGASTVPQFYFLAPN